MRKIREILQEKSPFQTFWKYLKINPKKISVNISEKLSTNHEGRVNMLAKSEYLLRKISVKKKESLKIQKYV